MTTGPQDPNAAGQPEPGPIPPGYPTPGAAPQYGGSSPQYGSPQNGSPEYGSPQYGTPQYDAPQYGGPQHQSPQYQQPQYPQYQQPYPGGANQMGGAGRPADLGSRFGARVLDSLIVGIPVLIVGFIFAAIGFAAAYNLGGSDTSFSVGFWIGSVIYSALSFAAWVGYFVWMESSRGQTLGKQICNIRTEGPNGGNPTIEQALRRNAYVVIFAGGSLIGSVLAIGSVLGAVGAAVSWISSLAALAIVIVMAATISSSPTKQGKHDEFAGGTRVVTTS